MIDNLNGLAGAFNYVSRSQTLARCTKYYAESLVRADMGAAAVQRHMSEWYRLTVNEAKRWLRAQDARADSAAFHAAHGFKLV